MQRYIFAVAAAACMAAGAVEDDTILAASPGHAVELAFSINSTDGTPEYAVAFKGHDVILPSHLGFVLKDGDFTRDFALLGAGKAKFSEIWHPVWGEETSIEDRHNELLVHLVHTPTKRLMDIRFRIFDDGVGFRYEFPAQGRDFAYFTIKDEKTQFALAGDHKIWWIPADYDTQEYRYFTSRISDIPRLYSTADRSNVSFQRPVEPGVQTAVVMKNSSGIYIHLHEAAVVDYPTMHLKLAECAAADGKERFVFESLLTPDAAGEKGRMQTPCVTPWRTVIFGGKATDILASRITLNLNEPCRIADTSWIRPMKYVGVWWEMITGRSEWSYTDDFPSVRLGATDYANAKPHNRHGATTKHVKEYIDFAAKHGFDAVLVEGWNIGWEDWFGHQKDYVFDFTTPYPDFDVAAIRDYARSKGVDMIMHHETSASTQNYERHLENAYRFMETNGYRTVKSGYVGNILPAGEHHYSQPLNNHYLYCVTNAAAHRICVNAHEAVRPTGLCRTWPNMIGNESARGGEYEAFDGHNPDHRTILPFTRLVGGPMDYTPGIFETDLSKTAPSNGNRNISSTLCGQLALYVTMYSPLQMACDLIENYEKHPDAFKFIEDVPVEWERTVYLDAEIGDYLAIARKDKNSADWYMGAITDENARIFNIPLDFLDDGAAYEAAIYRDAPDAAYDANAQAYLIEHKTVRRGDILVFRAGPGGGAAASFKRQ